MEKITQRLIFPELFEKPIHFKFDEPHSSSDGGALLLKAAAQKPQLTSALAACLVDGRQAAKVKHTIEDLLRQRIYGLASGYADANDAARLAHDPISRIASKNCIMVWNSTAPVARASEPTSFASCSPPPPMRCCRRSDGKPNARRWARAQVTTLRQHLLKLSARIEESVRRIVVHLPQTFAYAAEWTSIARRLGAAPG